MEQSEHSQEELVFIPLRPGKGRRRGIMISTAMGGLVLIVSSITISADTIASLQLKIFSIIAALSVIVLSVMEYKKPGSNRWLGADMIAVLTGLLIIAQGAVAYQPLKDFQPAHMLFLAGFLYIFKGSMFPQAKVKKGFAITETEIIYKSSIFVADKKIERINLKDIIMEGDDLLFQMKESETVRISLKGSENHAEILEKLNEAHHEI